MKGVPLGFQGSLLVHQILRKTEYSTEEEKPYLCLTQFQGISTVKEKRELFMRPILISPSSLVLPPIPILS